MTNDEALAIITEFRANAAQQLQLANSLNYFAMLCAASAKCSGFHDDEQLLRTKLSQHSDYESLTWFEAQLLQAELGRCMSELGEAIEAVRKNEKDSHLPQYPGWVVEIADDWIRGADTLGKRDKSIGSVVVDKLLYNMKRPYKHGKNS